jgi:hypothetical protein
MESQLNSHSQLTPRPLVQVTIRSSHELQHVMRFYYLHMVSTEEINTLDGWITS